MKKMLVLLAAFALTAEAASAQTAQPGRMGQGRMMGRQDVTPEQRADQMAQRLTAQLGLSTDQTAKVREIALAQAQEGQALRSKYATAGSREGLGPDLKALRDKYDTQLKSVLTPDQYAKYDQQRDDRMDKRKEKVKDGKQKVKAKA